MPDFQFRNGSPCLRIVRSLKSILIGFSLCLSLLMVACGQSPKGDNYRSKDGMIVFDEPAREAGQESMLGFAAEPIPVVRVGFVGLGK